MLGTFYYTFKKLIFKPSTIFITLFGFFIINTSLGYWLRGFQNYSYMSNDVVTVLTKTTISPFWNIILWLLLPILCGLKAISFIADEIEDGSFLTVISKPISRTHILIEKFIAYQTMMLLWTSSIVSFSWVGVMQAFPYKVTYDFFSGTFFPMIFVTFILQVILSTVLIVLSLRLKPGVIVGLSGFFGLFSQIGTQLIVSSVIQNGNYQSSIGQKIPSEDYEKLKSGQNTYDSFIKYFDYHQHFATMFFSQFQDIYLKYKSSSEITAFTNKKVIISETREVSKDDLGKEVFKDIVIVKGYENWISQDMLVLIYSLLTLLSIGLGFNYFRRRDII